MRYVTWRDAAIEIAKAENRRFKLKAQPCAIRRCLGCDAWMRSTGADHRICNACKGLNHSKWTGPGSLVKIC